MPMVQKSMRISLHDQIRFLKILGPAKETRYWQLLQSFLNYKLSKAELDNQVVSTIGKENVALHNQFLRAIYANALGSEAPPPPPSFVHDTSKPVKGVGRKPLVSSLSNEPTVSGLLVSAVRPNADGAIPSSPNKGRSTVRDRKVKERPSPLGFSHRTEAATYQGRGADGETPRSFVNGGLQLSQYSAEQSSLELPSPGLPHAKRPRLGFTGPGIRSSGDGKVEVGVSNRETEVDKIEEGEGSEESYEDDITGNELIKPPLGCIDSFGGPRVEKFVSKFPPAPVTHTLLGDKLEEEIPGEEYLPDTERLHRCMQLLAVERGLEDVNLETARCVNKALDVYLKAIIQPLVELVRARRTGQEVQTRENGRNLGEANCLDLKVALDLNPQVLGEDWPTQLERISFRAFDVFTCLQVFEDLL
ncbi:hypothetical protein R1sor_009719 [Riccia sorocarpa]|uniref:Transcriptional coactivator Hfi1/Transcriptional adapter 1 n=1 Tax=Riccia sorocarpa TaxID=122646 RepID=A0ABD3HVW2_9MARC